MDVIKFNYHSTRAEKARLSVILGGAWTRLLIVVTVLLLISGICFLAVGWAIGWALIGISVMPAMVVEWYKGELEHLAVAKKTQTVDDVLSANLLGLISRSPSPYEIATVIGQVPGGYFFAARFGIGASFLQETASRDTKDMPAIWQSAWEIREQTGSSYITAGVLIAALLENAPAHRSLLSHLQLDGADIIEGIEWYDHLHALVTHHAKPKKTGGVARDWSFGWIPLLNRFGENISQGGGSLAVTVHAHQDALGQLSTALGKGGRRNAILVGAAGVGKTQIVHAFAEQLLDGASDVPADLRFHQIFMLDANSLIAAAPGRGELEQLIMQILNEAYSAKNIIVCLDNAQLFFEEAVGSVDLSNVLLPIIEAGRLRMILTMDEQRYLQIGQRNSQLVGALNRINIAPATEFETMKIMQDQLIVIEFRHKVTFMYQALREAYRLSMRYIHDLAMPGQALKLLEDAAGFAENGLVTAHSVQQTIEKTLGVKASVTRNDDDREKLLNLESLIHERMINQSRAVSVVSDALRRARSGVRNPDRPIGTFLFLGPTGVGKTELAKALADVYFDGEDCIIRVDLNEYVTNKDVARLIADGTDDSNSLTARVMKQPFSVVLLDEVEKAHPNVLTTLLQMLDEGILRDVRNREVSFRDTIVIATSNAGADRIREYIDRGLDMAQFEDQFVDELISSNQFRPEFLNRFDEIVIFRPLNKDELVQVVDLMLVGINKTLALQKVSVTVTQDAKLYLVDAGFDPRLGARPMRRVVQRAVENTVAKLMLSGDVQPGETIEITLGQVQAILGSKQKADEIIASSASAKITDE